MYNDFVDLVKKAARHNIPRGCEKEYIPGLSDESSDLLKLYDNYPNPIYLGVTLDRSLSFKQHALNTKAKVKAFARVNHRILFTKPGNRGTPQYIIRILSFWYANQQMCIRWGATYSTSFNVSNGVLQGSILSPYLFNIYIDDPSLNLNACRVGCCVGTEIINQLMYADDLVIMAPSVAGLSKLLIICELFGASHDMIFNQKKSASVCFIYKTLKSAHLPNVYLNGEVILQVDSVKYLGHHLTNDLHDDLDIRRQCRAINVRGNILFRKFHMCSVSVKLKLFNS